MRTVDELETAGVAALTIEDTELPAAFGGTAPRLVSIDEGVGKMRAALAARHDPDLVIVGRTAAPTLTSTADAIARAKAYAAAGVDALFFVGVRKRAELDTLAAAVSLPIILGGAGAELEDGDYLAARGVRVALQGHQPIMAAVEAVHATLKALRDGAKPAAIPGVASGERMRQITRDADYKRWAEEFLKPK
jgi:carboxyvinyl-carboxyphosphonate phosphorylmutase